MRREPPGIRVFLSTGLIRVPSSASCRSPAGTLPLRLANRHGRLSGAPELAWSVLDPRILRRRPLAFAGLLTGITEALCGPERSRGALFLASSAGGVYAGVGTPPFREDSPVAPLAPYGWNKLEQESLARQWSTETGTPLLVGRLSNLYGPGQNLSKAQGLITQMCLRVVARQPLVLYVPLDTIRDYLFAEDAGRLIAHGLARLRLDTRCVPAKYLLS